MKINPAAVGHSGAMLIVAGTFVQSRDSDREMPWPNKTSVEFVGGRAGRSSSVQSARTGQLTITLVTLDSVL